LSRHDEVGIRPNHAAVGSVDERPVSGDLPGVFGAKDLSGDRPQAVLIVLMTSALVIV
jgi:hypothetical protein